MVINKSDTILLMITTIRPSEFCAPAPRLIPVETKPDCPQNNKYKTNNCSSCFVLGCFAQQRTTNVIILVLEG